MHAVIKQHNIVAKENGLAIYFIVINLSKRNFKITAKKF